MSIEFWVSVGSIYSYFSVMRLAEVEARHDLVFDVRPFNLRDIMVQRDGHAVPRRPRKTAYLWRDLEKRARTYGLHPNLPIPYPIDALPFANAIAVVGLRQGWMRGYVTEAYRLWFEDGLEPGTDIAVARALEGLADPAEVSAAARTPETTAELAMLTATARGLGVYGAPSFVTGGQVFRGDERMEHAIAIHRTRPVT